MADGDLKIIDTRHTPAVQPHVPLNNQRTNNGSANVPGRLGLLLTIDQVVG